MENTFKLTRFNIIVAVDADDGIGRDGIIPWKCKEDLEYFKKQTMNCNVIVGRKTFETLPHLEGRNVVVVSKDLSLLKALRECVNDKETWIIGGQVLYESVICDYLYLCDEIHITYISGTYDCDTFFVKPKEVKLTRKTILSDSAYVEVYTPTLVHQEYEYLNALKLIMEKGKNKPDRTGVGTRSIHGITMRFDISEEVPFLTTKKLFHEKVKQELVWFLSGSTNSKELEKQGNNIWKHNSSLEFIESRGLSYKEGDLGPIYSFQWKHFGAEYKTCDDDYTGKGIDQIQNVIDLLKTDPFSRRIIVNSWNVKQLEEMVLPPCHYSFQFLVRKEDENLYLDCILSQRSGDFFLGVPFNIASYTMLTYMICKEVDMKPGELIMNIADCHIYNNHIDSVKEQLNRTPLPLCKLDENCNPVNYISWNYIRGKCN